MSKIFNLQRFAEGETSGMADTSSLATSSGGDVGTGASVDTSNGSLPDSQESFDSLISGRYKADYEARRKEDIKSAIDKRFKNNADYQKKYEGLMPAMELVAERYGFDTSDMSKLDMEGLVRKITEDSSYYEQEAFEKGMDVNALMRQKALERENKQLKQMQAAQNAAVEQQQFHEDLQRRATEVKGMYPDFDLQTEMQNDTFMRILANLDAAGDKDAMRTAYEVIHKDEILATGMQYAAQKTAEKVANGIRSGATRQTGVPMSASGAATLSVTDPRTFTKEDFARLKREAERGKKVYLN